MLVTSDQFLNALLASLVVGVVAGVLAIFAVYRAVPNTSWEWVGAILLGLVGGWVGDLLARVLGLASVNWLGSLIVAFIGAALILLALRRMTPRARV